MKIIFDPILGKLRKSEEVSTVDSGFAPVYNDLDPVISQTNTPQLDMSGDRYLIGAAPTGIWVGKANQIAEGTGAGFTYYIPVLDDYVYITSTLQTLKYNGTSWVPSPSRAILQDGNSFGAQGVRIGTNDANPTWLKYNNTLRFRLDGADIRTQGSLLLGGIASAATARLDVIGVSNTGLTRGVRLRNSDLLNLLTITDAGKADFTAAYDGNVTGIDTTSFSSSAGGTRTSYYALTGAETQINFFENAILKVNIFSGAGGIYNITAASRIAFKLQADGKNKLFMDSAGNIGVGDEFFATSAKLHVKSAGNTGATFTAKYENSSSSLLFNIRDDGNVYSHGKGAIASNTAYGLDSFISNLTGADNTAFGVDALRSNTTGGNNTAVGKDALYNNNGSFNSAIGFTSLNANTSGERNLATGYGALSTNTSGFRNTAIGMFSGNVNVLGDNNVFIGYNANPSVNNLTNAIAIGSQATVSESNTMVLGNDLRVVIGATSATAKLHVKGESNTLATFTSKYQNSSGIFSLMVRDDGAVYNLGAGSVVSNTAFGADALISNTSGFRNTAFGKFSLSSNTIAIKNTAVGYASLYLNISGDNNTAIGDQSLFSNTSGLQNTAVGSNSLYSNTIGAYNTAVGVNALSSNTTGEQNIAIGILSLASNTTSSNNLAIGSYSLLSNTSGSSNMGLGYQSLKNNTTGSENIGIGYNSGIAGTTGSNNISIGNSALFTATTGGQNIAIGNITGYDITTATNNTFIGYNTGRGITTGVSNTIIGGSITGLAAALSNNIILADGDGVKRLQFDNTGALTLTGPAVSAAVATVSTNKIKVNVGGTDYYLLVTTAP